MQKYLIGDTVSYGIHGVCTVDDIKEMEFSGKTENYYVLKPCSDNRSTIFVPCENETLVSRMKKLLSAREIRELIKLMPEAEHFCIGNAVERKRKYAEILARGNRKELIILIKTVYTERQNRVGAGKKPQTVDEYFLKEAEKQLYEEFAYVLKIAKEDVLPFIMGELENKNADSN